MIGVDWNVDIKLIFIKNTLYTSIMSDTCEFDFCWGCENCCKNDCAKCFYCCPEGHPDFENWAWVAESDGHVYNPDGTVSKCNEHTSDAGSDYECPTCDYYQTIRHKGYGLFPRCEHLHGECPGHVTDWRDRAAEEQYERACDAQEDYEQEHLGAAYYYAMYPDGQF